MSENNSNGRKGGVRIVRVGAVDNGASARKLNADREQTPRPGQRTRAFGAPLATATPTRNLKPATQANKNAFIQAMADVPSTAMPGPSSEYKNQSSVVEGTSTAPILDDEAPPAIIWEQSFFPEFSSQEEAPRWVTNPALTPTDQEFAALGAYVKYMVDGFSVFCRMPSVEESGNWHARLKMPQVVMPDTMLDVNISRFHARLRFETDHRVSRELLTRYASQLQAQVVAALDDNREVEVTVW